MVDVDDDCHLSIHERKKRKKAKKKKAKKENEQHIRINYIYNKQH